MNLKKLGLESQSDHRGKVFENCTFCDFVGYKHWTKQQDGAGTDWFVVSSSFLLLHFLFWRWRAYTDADLLGLEGLKVHSHSTLLGLRQGQGEGIGASLGLGRCFSHLAPAGSLDLPGSSGSKTWDWFTLNVIEGSAQQFNFFYFSV